MIYTDIPVDLPRPRYPDNPAVRDVQADVLRRFDSMGAAVQFGGARR